jgi:hypothetical protein
MQYLYPFLNIENYLKTQLRWYSLKEAMLHFIFHSSLKHPSIRFMRSAYVNNGYTRPYAKSWVKDKLKDNLYQCSL